MYGGNIQQKNQPTKMSTSTTVQLQDGKIIKRKNSGTILKETFMEYCDSSSIHGIKYMRKNPVERTCWVIIITISLVFCCSLILRTIARWKENPIDLVFEKRFTPIKELVFPAITICPQRMPNQTLLNFTRLLKEEKDDIFAEYNLDELKCIDFTSQICADSLLRSQKSLMNIMEKFPYNEVEIYGDNFTYLQKFLPSSENVVGGCIDNVEGKFYEWDCGLSFHQMLLDDGNCYTFNMKPKTEILRPGVYFALSEQPFNKKQDNVQEKPDDTQAKPRIYPYKMTSTQHIFAFGTTFESDFNDQICRPEFLLFIHKNDQIPWDSSNAYILDVDRYAKIEVQISPNKLTSSKELKEKFTSEERGCFFQDEHPLKYFLNYSQNHCDMECWITYAQKDCNCTPFWAPHFPNMKHCSMNDAKCIDDFSISDQCNCLPECENDITFNLRLKQSLSKDFGTANKEASISLFSFSYEESEVLVWKRVAAYTFTDFIAQIGGILGLFLGFSLISCAEIFYFCTVRLFSRCNEAQS